MTREIKFRAWDKNSCSMFFGNPVYHKGELDFFVEDITGSHLSPKYGGYDFVVMQSTGVTDKNGIEIYKSDIVARPYITPFGDITDSSDGVFEIVYEHGTYGFKATELAPLINWLDTKKGEYIPNYGNLTIYGKCILEVIGNIYQDSHLIDKSE